MQKQVMTWCCNTEHPLEETEQCMCHEECAAFYICNPTFNVCPGVKQCTFCGENYLLQHGKREHCNGCLEVEPLLRESLDIEAALEEFEYDPLDWLQPHASRDN